MTTREVKQWLLRARQLQARIDQLEEAQRTAFERATSTTQAPRADAGGHSGVSRKPEMYGELAGAVDAELKRLDAVKAEIVAVIGKVDDNALASLLMGYYVSGKTWEQVCVDIHYSYIHTVHRLHPAALAAVGEILEVRNGGTV